LFPSRTTCNKASSAEAVLAVDFHNFYRQHFSGFHTFMAKIMLNLFILMSFTSFDDYFRSSLHKFQPNWEET
jgi:hypothetical protein